MYLARAAPRSMRASPARFAGVRAGLARCACPAWTPTVSGRLRGGTFVFVEVVGTSRALDAIRLAARGRAVGFFAKPEPGFYCAAFEGVGQGSALLGSPPTAAQ